MIRQSPATRRSMIFVAGQADGIAAIAPVGHQAIGAHRRDVLLGTLIDHTLVTWCRHLPPRSRATTAGMARSCSVPLAA